MKNLGQIVNDKDIVTKDHVPTNWVNGSAAGSVRGINTATEDSSYTMGLYAFAEGGFTKASGYSSHAEGSGSTASGNSSHAEGSSVTASGSASHAEGAHTTASGSQSHAEGWQTTANDEQSHAEGYMTIASNTASHAEGQFTLAGGTWSHAEGYYTQASGETSHSQNAGTIAQRKSQTALGEYNIADTSGTTTTRGDYVVIVGNGADNDNRSNALTIDWDGNVNIASGAHYKVNGSNLSASDVGAQAALVSGTNIKTINNQSLLGSGDLTINVPTKTSDLTNDSGFITGYTETDPTVPSWAKASTKPSYTANEISGLLDFFYPVGSYYESSMSSAIPSGTYPPTQADLDLLGVTWFNPNYAWGGEWVLETEGHVHVSSGTNYTVNGANLDSGRGVKDGGDKDAILVSHNHTFTGNALGNHDHTFTGNALGAHSHGTGNSTHNRFAVYRSTTDGILRRTIKNGTGTSLAGNVYTDDTWSRLASTQSVSAGTPSGTVVGKSAGTPSGSISTEGSSGTDANMQPYIVVKRWHRTA